MLKSNKFVYNFNLSYGNPSSSNILIEGDNKEILPELLKDFAGKIKCVYIDPPYNNGDTYAYYSDKIAEDIWLKDIRNVLYYLHILLREDGSVWISIDDGEMAYLKVEADKVFGRENFAGTIVWQHRKSRENRAVFSNNHEYILVYAKNLKKFKKGRNLLPVNEEFIREKYKNPDNDPRGPWQSVTASVQAGHAVPSQFYTIVSPSGVSFNPPKGRCWVYNEDRMLKEIKEGNIWFGREGTSTPRIKKFLNEAKIGLTPQTLWCGDEFGSTDSAKKHLLSMFYKNDTVFDTPKPEELVSRIIEIATNVGDIVLDCYLGSGTTLAVAHKSGRHYIGIEIGRQMAELVHSRLIQVVEGESGGASEALGWKGGGDFAYYNFDKNIETNFGELPDVSKVPTQRTSYRQLDLYSLFNEFGEEAICENSYVSDNCVNLEEDQPSWDGIFPNKDVLVSLVKKDNEQQFLDSSATIYYTGKRFPSSVALNKLYYFIPYIKGKGIQDLYLIKIARIGTRKEGQISEDKNDLRLVFELQFVRRLFKVPQPFDLKIWRTYTDTTLDNILDFPARE